MFDQVFVNARAQTRRPWAVAVSFFLQTGLVTGVLIAPLMNIAVLPQPESVPLSLRIEKLKRAAEPEVKPVARAVSPHRPIFRTARLQAPLTVPKSIDMTADAPDIGNAGMTGPATGQLLSALPPGTSSGMTIQPSPPPVKAQPPLPVRITSGVQSAKLTFGPRPVYPPLARATRIQGTVRIQAVIGRDGSIRNLEALSGPPLLIAAAMEAVRQWRYRPSLLNGEPVEVLTDIEVNFIIGR